MSRTNEFISSLENFELAFLRKYKLKSYLKPTQEKIIQEIDKRELNEDDLIRMISQIENNRHNTGCPRCNSNKIRTDQIDVVGSAGGGAGKIIYLGAAAGSGHDVTSKGERVICLICGYVLKDDDKKDSTFGRFLSRIVKLAMSKMKTGANN